MNKGLLLAVYFAYSTTFANILDERIKLVSPDKNLSFELNISNEGVFYNVNYKGNAVIKDSELSLYFENGHFGRDLKMLNPSFREIKEEYELVVGKAKNVLNHCHEVRIPLVERKGERRQIDFVFRAFNDGVAFRYEFPEQSDWTSYTLIDERSTFNISGNPMVYTMMWGDFNHSHERPYHKLSLEKIKNDTLLDLPSLFEFPGHIYLAITEANLRNYAGMYLVKRNGILRSQLSPLQGQIRNKVIARLPHHTPWRVLMVSDRIGDLIESNILTSLCDPPEIEDTSWIKPGKTTFHWWNGDIVPDTTFAPGINFLTNKYYIDFCARNNIEYHAVIGYGGIAWFENNWKGYGSPGSYADVTKPVPSLDMQKVCDYAKEQGVGIHVWVHWKALYPQLEEAFTEFEKWGINGLMVDFLNRDDQEMVNIQEEILECAARHKLYIQFHGAYKPTGLHRTYPNEFTREGTLNYEQNKWREEGISPDHDIIMPFTRLLAGATDYHIGGFRAVPSKNFKPQYTRPLMVGTRAHMLGMYIVLESYLASVCDYPEAYKGEPGFDFISEVPTVWDETRVLDAKVGEFIVIARRKGNDWFVGSINNSRSRSIIIDFGFLEINASHTAKIYRDAPDSYINPNNLIIESTPVKRIDKLKIDICAGGGFVIKITRTE